ncbi:S41 family peptidase [Chitinophagaceae bacterium LB-8]|uniref:S41 family peptidase n=1 Tax=Paraflavisolibacter caeni TaxID=2982496 RepID=A0A9X3BH42_9BACT|nr:S41 family peptidase [Paraflavisolibacter caeni]MCU7548917.1 S41 family peptidase [Paraflavisolibacter caeni]
MTDSLAPEPNTNDTLTEIANKQKDTALMFSKDLYLWYSQIPSTFNARSYSDLAGLMKGIRQYSKESGFSNPVDRWSFAIKKEEWAQISSGGSGNFGLNVSFNEEKDLRVKAVDVSSPAGKAGIRRGWQIIAINGNSNISTDNADFIANNVLNSPTASFTFLKPDGTTTNIRLATTSTQDHSVYLDTVYNYGGKKIGYFVFNSFLGDTVKIYEQFLQTFNRFANAKISDLIVDLRYNGGGYVSVQQKLANYLAPNSANGGLMMKQTFNDKFPDYNTTDYFEKIGTLNLPRIIFIVSNSTASASELLINNLKPYMEVKLVGPSNTYGKPVGYFPIEVGDWDIFPISFRSTNKNGDGNFFNGLAVNSQVKDDLNKDWGDLEEACLARSIRYLTTGSFTSRIASREEDNSYVEQPKVKAGNEVLERSSFKGLIDPRGM